MAFPGSPRTWLLPITRLCQRYVGSVGKCALREHLCSPLCSSHSARKVPEQRCLGSMFYGLQLKSFSRVYLQRPCLCCLPPTGLGTDQGDKYHDTCGLPSPLPAWTLHLPDQACSALTPVLPGRSLVLTGGRTSGCPWPHTLDPLQ